MKRYFVTVEERRRWGYTVEAESAEEAEAIIAEGGDLDRFLLRELETMDPWTVEGSTEVTA